MEMKGNMNHEKKLKILANFLIELQKSGMKISADAIKDLRSAKILIQILKADNVDPKIVSKIDKYLKNVESYVIYNAEKVGTINVEEWLEKLNDPKKEVNKEKTETKYRFVSGIPRNKNWMLVETSEKTPTNFVKKHAKENNLSFKIQKNGQIIIYGNEKEIKSFVKRITKRFKTNRHK
jgi:hypothetical protein